MSKKENLRKDQRVAAIKSELDKKIKLLNLRKEVMISLYNHFKKIFNKYPMSESCFRLGILIILDEFIDDLEQKSFESIVKHGWIAHVKDGISYKLIITGTDRLMIHCGFNEFEHIEMVQIPSDIYRKLLMI